MRVLAAKFLPFSWMLFYVTVHAVQRHSRQGLATKTHERTVKGHMVHRAASAARLKHGPKQETSNRRSPRLDSALAASPGRNAQQRNHHIFAPAPRGTDNRRSAAGNRGSMGPYAGRGIQ